MSSEGGATGGPPGADDWSGHSAGDRPSGRAETVPGPGRVAAIDVARAVALFGMMTVHVLSSGDGLGGTLHDLAGGRSAALFAVLAGVGLALGSGADRPTPDRLRRARWAIPVRALAIGAIGLTLGLLTTPVAIILVYYAVLFLVAVPVLGWSPLRLGVAAACWAVLSPVISQLLRASGFDDGPGTNPAWTDVTDLGDTAVHLLLNGYYPVLTWVTYLLAGLAVGRLALQRPETGRWLAAVGAGLAVTAWAVAAICVRLAGGAEELGATLNPGAYVAGRGEELLNDSFFGTTPTTSWWFLGVMAPHSGAAPDLVHTTGTALLVIGLALILVPRLGRVVGPLAAAGSMTLTLYSLHVIGLGFLDAVDPDHSWPVWPVLIVNVVVALFIAVAWDSPHRRGPLEELVATAVEVTVPDRRHP